ncbi:MAG: diaminopimelate decarboxylase, partial [Candidatus Omnitrophica bacterium]|nr:diaminopimelate decarboxylase [Candidatus Omnitrophota bacterium]
YNAYHQIVPLSRRVGELEKVDVVGPICESGDFLAKERLMAKVKEGDYLAVMSAGAYGFSMSSNYNSRLRAAEVMVAKNKALVIRKRESAQDLVRNEVMVNNFTKR